MAPMQSETPVHRDDNVAAGYIGLRRKIRDDDEEILAKALEEDRTVVPAELCSRRQCHLDKFNSQSIDTQPKSLRHIANLPRELSWQAHVPMYCPVRAAHVNRLHQSGAHRAR
jgi:hypothetical protein